MLTDRGSQRENEPPRYLKGHQSPKVRRTIVMSKSSGSGFFPVARPIPGSDNASSAGSPESLQALQNMMPNPDLPQGNLPIPFPQLHFCALSLPQGCYKLNITSTASSPT